MDSNSQKDSSVSDAPPNSGRVVDSPPQNAKQAGRMFLLGGLLPVIAFTVVEQWYGVMGGVIAGITFGLGEIAWEYRTTGRIQKITLGSNFLVLILGIASLWEGDGIWFKLQPSLILLVFAGILIGSSWLKKPFLVAIIKKQNPNAPALAIEVLRGLNFRLGVLLLLLTAVSVHAALYWTTASWAMFKGFGVPVVMVLYFAVEVLVIRWWLRRQNGQ